MGSYMRSDGRAVINKDLDFVLTTFPRLAERLKPGCVHAVGRRAADVRHRPRHHGQSAAVDDRRVCRSACQPKLVGELSKALLEINRSGPFRSCWWSRTVRDRAAASPQPASCSTPAVSFCQARPPTSPSIQMSVRRILVSAA